jgi:hypothetical protein
MEDRLQPFARPVATSAGSSVAMPIVLGTEQPLSCPWLSQSRHWTTQSKWRRRCLTSSYEAEFSFRSRGGGAVNQSLDAEVETIPADYRRGYAL